MEKGAAQKSSKLKGKGVTWLQEPKNKGVKVTTSTQSTHKRKKRKLSTSGEESDELRRGSENITSKKVKKCSWICEDDEATLKDDEAILDDTDDEVEVLSHHN